MTRPPPVFEGSNPQEKRSAVSKGFKSSCVELSTRTIGKRRRKQPTWYKISTEHLDGAIFIFCRRSSRRPQPRAHHVWVRWRACCEEEPFVVRPSEHQRATSSRTLMCTPPLHHLRKNLHHRAIRAVPPRGCILVLQPPPPTTQIPDGILVKI